MWHLGKKGVRKIVPLYLIDYIYRATSLPRPNDQSIVSRFTWDEFCDVDPAIMIKVAFDGMRRNCCDNA